MLSKPKNVLSTQQELIMAYITDTLSFAWNAYNPAYYGLAMALICIIAIVLSIVLSEIVGDKDELMANLTNKMLQGSFALFLCTLTFSAALLILANHVDKEEEFAIIETSPGKFAMQTSGTYFGIHQAYYFKKGSLRKCFKSSAVDLLGREDKNAECYDIKIVLDKFLQNLVSLKFFYTENQLKSGNMEKLLKAFFTQEALVKGQVPDFIAYEKVE